MIDEKKLAELRKTWDVSNQDVHFFSRSDFEALAKTIESLWKENAELKASGKFMGARYYSSMEETYSTRIDELMRQNKKLEAVARAAEEVIGELGLNQSMDELEKALKALKEKP